jgi:hypothetical protein
MNEAETRAELLDPQLREAGWGTLLYPNADSDNTVLLVIALVAIILFMLMLFAAFIIVRSEKKTKTAASSKDKLGSGSPAAGNTTPHPEDGKTTEVRPTSAIKAHSFATNMAGPPSSDKWENINASSPRAILDQLPKLIQTLNWIVCFLAVTYFAWLNYSRLGSDLEKTSLYPYFVWLAILSPTCIAIAWLRLTGVRWLQCLLLFVPVTAAFGVIRIISSWLSACC